MDWKEDERVYKEIKEWLEPYKVFHNSLYPSHSWYAYNVSDENLEAFFNKLWNHYEVKK